MLQSFIRTMLPKNAENVFGKGTAGEVWKSMLAEKLADEIARSGQIGIAKRLAAVEAARTAARSLPATVLRLQSATRLSSAERGLRRHASQRPGRGSALSDSTSPT